MKKLPCLVLAALLAVPASAMAQEIIWDGPLSEYGQRTDSVTLGAGDAKEANSAIHTVDPSPPAARNRRHSRERRALVAHHPPLPGRDEDNGGGTRDCFGDDCFGGQQQR